MGTERHSWKLLKIPESEEQQVCGQDNYSIGLWWLYLVVTPAALSSDLPDHNSLFL